MGSLRLRVLFLLSVLPAVALCLTANQNPISTLADEAAKVSAEEFIDNIPDMLNELSVETGWQSRAGNCQATVLQGGYTSVASAQAACNANAQCRAVWGPWHHDGTWQQRGCSSAHQGHGWCRLRHCSSGATGHTCNTQQGGTTYFKPCSTHAPTATPTNDPTFHPTRSPTSTPTDSPTTLPPTTDEPSNQPTHTPTHTPTNSPTSSPTAAPTFAASRCRQVCASDNCRGTWTNPIPSGQQWTTVANGVHTSSRGCCFAWSGACSTCCH